MASIFRCSSYQSSINKVPDDVLREIFIHCLPENPLAEPQPNTKIAPMLLCQVCSSWRAVALTYPTLWSHLNHSFNVIDPKASPWKVREDQFAFFSWWKQNQRFVAPFLRLAIDLFPGYRARKFRFIPLRTPEMNFLLGIITSAQYLDLDPLYWIRIEESIEKGSSVEWPNLQTLVKCGRRDIDTESFFFKVQSLAPNFPFPLRRLSIKEGAFSLHNSAIPNHWSTLTHISLFRINIRFRSWISLLRAVPNLQLGQFDVKQLFNLENYRPEFECVTLPNLSTLVLIVHALAGNFAQFSFSMLLSNFHLPALHSLSLRFFTWGLFNYQGITELFQMLQSTPSVQTLTLGGSYSHKLYLPKDSSVDTLSAMNAVSMWHIATQLSHLRLERLTGFIPTKEEMPMELNDIIASSLDASWLDLGNPLCPIQTLAIIYTADDTFRPHFPGDGDLEILKSGRTEKAPNIIFQLFSVANKTREGATEEWRPKP